jgi:hypothetical protein
LRDRKTTFGGFAASPPWRRGTIAWIRTLLAHGLAGSRVNDVKTIRIAKQKARKAPAVDNEDPQLIGAHADYRREDFVFARTQSLEMRGLEWETRMKPLKSWVPNFAANLAFEIFSLA